jgi:NAD(P) transhydrogenase subunit beta
MALVGMLIAVITTLFQNEIIDFTFIIAGIVLGSAIGAISARAVEMTAMPQMVAIFNGFGGGASVFVALAEYYRYVQEQSVDVVITLILSVFVGSITFTGSMIAFAKLQNLISGRAILFRFQQAINAVLGLAFIIVAIIFISDFFDQTPLLIIAAISLSLGVLLVLPIGSADMPVIVSLLNSYSGIAAAMTGFVLQNNVLIISGSLVGASGLILTNIMCKAMNRSLANVIFGGVGAEAYGGSGQKKDRSSVAQYSEEDAVMMLESAQSVIIVPGYGLAVAQAHFALQEAAQLLIERGVNVRYAIHPVAGRMPGHMNVLLAEANVPYDLLKDLDEINDEFKNTDIALVIGANDVINPAARTEKTSPLYGMPILNVDQCKTVMIVKRSLSPGFSGVDNELFYDKKTMMLFGDA